MAPLDQNIIKKIETKTMRVAHWAATALLYTLLASEAQCLDIEADVHGREGGNKKAPTVNLRALE